jgi:hypothetical protein
MSWLSARDVLLSDAASALRGGFGLLAEDGLVGVFRIPGAGVGAGAAVQTVVAGTAIQVVVAVASPDVVLAVAAVDGVVAVLAAADESAEGVVARATIEVVPPGFSDRRSG